MDFHRAMLDFFMNDLGGNRVTDAKGNVLYEDEKAAFVSREETNWRYACPPPREGQRGEIWDLLRRDSKTTYMVITSTFTQGRDMLQIHHLIDASFYMNLVRDITDFSRTLQAEKEHDRLTGLYNQGKFMALKESLFRGQDSIAVFNMDVNNLKQINDSCGHEAGNALILKAAESLRRIEARNVMGFRVGGDEFIVVALHVSREEADKLLHRWREGLDALNREPDGIFCVVACGMAYAEAGYVLEEVLARADSLMYEDKKARKNRAEGSFLRG